MSADNLKLGGFNQEDSSSMLERITRASQEDTEKRKPRPFGSYISELLKILEDNPSFRPIMTADERIYLAMSGKKSGSEAEKNQQNENIIPLKKKKNQEERRTPFFHDREDCHQIFGNFPTVKELMTFVKSRAEGGPNLRKGALILGPTGAGKTQFAEAIMYGTEEETKKQDQSFTIEGCPIQENALHLLPNEIKREFKKVYGLEITQELCPHCRGELDNKYGGDRMKMMVKPREFAVDSGNGLSHMEAPMADPLASEEERRLREQMLLANGGIMELAEIFHFPPSYLRSLLDIIRNRQIQLDGKVYSHDALTIAHATLNDLYSFQAYADDEVIDTDAFLQRFQIFILPYILQYSEEARLYGKELHEQNHFINGKHVSDKTLEIAAKYGVLTRLREESDITLTNKLELYDGKEVEGYTQADRERFENNGRDYKSDTDKIHTLEGMNGSSPVDMLGFVSNQVTAAEKCLSPLDMVRALKNQSEGSARRGLNNMEKLEAMKNIRPLERDVESWAEQIVRQSFREGYEDQCRDTFNAYIDHVTALRDGDSEVDSITGHVIRPNLAFITSIEENMQKTEIDPMDTNKKTFKSLTQAEIEQLRTDMLTRAGSIGRTGEILSYESIPVIKDGIERFVTGESDEDINQTLLSRISSKGIDVSAKKEMDEKLKKVEHVLVDKYGCCPHCAPELIKHVANIIQNREKSSSGKSK